ncbi:hypothetical protein [Saccharopolyspora taberi]|uniref:PPE family protein n=1 Tax=Saccharopolyspora taberi TaxID=60895 RepID=A0ABN3VBR2_9PSEU
METFDWAFGVAEVPAPGQAPFDHPKIYREVEAGPGVASASRAEAIWLNRVSAAFREADVALEAVLRKFDVVMWGAAGDQAKESMTPLSKATREAAEVAADVSVVVGRQAQGSADFKNAFPPPHVVPPDNIGWSDYVNPFSYAVKSGLRAMHEEVHIQVETHARQQYTSYADVSNERVSGVQKFSPLPVFSGEVGPAQTKPVDKIDPRFGYASTENTTLPTPVAHTPMPIPTQAQPNSPVAEPSPTPEAPAESGSAWVAPAAATAPNASGTGPATASSAGGAVVPPTSAGGVPAGGTGTGRGGAGKAGGNGKSGGERPGGGRSSVGGSGGGAKGTTGTTSARVVSGFAGAPGVADRGQRAEDKDHVNKYVDRTGEAWQELGLPQVAPAVFGDWDSQDQEGKPPRPPEADA